MHVLAVLLAYLGSLRTCEVQDLKWTDVSLDKETGDLYLTVGRRKTTGNGKVTAWTVPSTVTNWSSPIPHYKLVRQARTDYEHIKGKMLPDHFFLNMRDGAVTNQNVGIHTLTGIATAVAKFNGLTDGRWSFYSFRRSSATQLALAGASPHQLQQQLGHKTTATATEYIDSSVAMQRLASTRLAGMSDAGAVGAAASPASSTTQR